MGPAPARPLLLVLLLLLVAVPCPGLLGGLCPPRCRCRRRVLDCSRAALPTVPPAARRRAPGALDFTGNSISSTEEQAWRGYQWAESLLLQDNDLQAVKRSSLEGLLLLKHLDLSRNKILSLEERAFEPLPFLQLLNLGGNLITQIRNGTFQAWHRMQFLQKLILSHNPLSVIADTSFFKLPSVKYLDLSATQVTQQTLLTLLLTTVRLEKLKLSSDMACCLCQEKHTTETSCRTIEFHCQNLCTTTSASQCAHADPLSDTPGEIMEAGQSRKLDPSPVLSLQPKQPSLVDRKTVRPAVVLSLTITDGDLSNPNDHVSRTNSYSPQHPSGQEGKTTEELMLHHIQHMDWTSKADLRKLHFLAEALGDELKKLHKAKNIMTVKNTISAAQKDEVQEIPAVEGGTTTGWVQNQQDLGLNQAALNPRAAAGWLNPTDEASRHPKISTPPSEHLLLHPPAQVFYLSESFKMQNHSNAVEQTKKTRGLEDVEDAEGAEEAPPARQDYAWTHRKHKQGDTLALDKHSQLFSEMFDNGNPEEEPTPTGREAEQGLNPNQQFFPSLLVTNSPPAPSSGPEKVAEDDGSSLGGHLPGIPQTTETSWKQPKKAFSFLNKAGNSDSPDDVSVQRDLFETKVHGHLRLLVPDEALRTFIAHVAGALRMDCNLPRLQPACTKLVSKTRLLIKLLSERQDDPGASAFEGWCLLEGEVFNHTSQAKEKPVYMSSERLVAISMSVVIIIILTVLCLIEACSKKPAASSQPQSSRKSLSGWFCPNLLSRRKAKPKDGAGEQGQHVVGPSRRWPRWLRDLQQLLGTRRAGAGARLGKEETVGEEETSGEEELFSRCPPSTPEDRHW